MKRLLFSIFMVALVAMSAACSKASPGPLADDLGRPLDISKVPQKIVSLAPSNTEILFALGLGDKVVGVTDFCDYPPEAKTKPSVGSQYPGFDIEKIASLQPDLAVGFGYTAPDYVAKLEGLGIKVVVLAPKDITGVESDIDLIGNITGTEKQAKSITDDMKTRVAAVVNKVKGASQPKVLWEFDATDPTKPWVAGPGGYNDALIKLAGGMNIAAEGASSSFQMSTEEIVSDNPQVIILGDYQYGTRPEDVGKRPGWSAIDAVKNNRVYPVIDSNLTDRPGPRIVDGLEAIAKMVHPELFQ